ncbi:hypothetical protein ACFSCZ_19025 [Siminovitchia sediminis]|uniref:Type II secretion system protein n=1 Tax=Siminovitchia sediminis TaxID=1274353 RepID=A0ABW4KNF4_9BACI
MKAGKIIFTNERGATLAELLASVILITLILTVLITIFIQSAKTNKISEHILNATYLAQTEMEHIYSASLDTPYTSREAAITTLGYTQKPEREGWLVFERRPIEGEQLVIRVRLQSEELKKNLNRIVVEVLEGSDHQLRAKMEHVLRWKDEAG